MRSKHLVRRSFLVAVIAGLFSVGFASHTSATGGPRRDFIHDRYTQRDSTHLINRYEYANTTPIHNKDRDGH
jgi:hypothetical protein